MGHLVDFRCPYCRYEEKDVAVGHGRAAVPFLKLFSCPSCHSFGSCWIEEGKIPRCSWCYHDAVTLVADDAPGLACPKCGEPAKLNHRPDDTWA
ncbi:MAG: hypothetical protein M0Z44_00490 [Gammaproteobacteria bacterium]|nr:hypothetical protein [Gammaproteobacteria bacterium]